MINSGFCRPDFQQAQGEFRGSHRRPGFTSPLQNTSPSSYQSLLDYLFDPTDAANSAGLSYIRIPLGSSDLSANAYTYDDVAGDTTLARFSINSTPSYVFSTLNDIKNINNRLKLHFVPWSPVSWSQTH